MVNFTTKLQSGGPINSYMNPYVQRGWVNKKSTYPWQNLHVVQSILCLQGWFASVVSNETATYHRNNTHGISVTAVALKYNTWTLGFGYKMINTMELILFTLLLWMSEIFLWLLRTDLCSVADSGCGLSKRWSRTLLRTARKAHEAVLLTRTEGSAPQTSLWRQHLVDRGGPKTHSSSFH